MSRKRRKPPRSAPATGTAAPEAAAPPERAAAPAAAPAPAEQQPIVIHPPTMQGDLGDPAAATFEHGEPFATQVAPSGATLGDDDYSSVPDVGPSNADDVVAEPGTQAVEEPKRAYSLDALRGFFLLLMTLGFTIQPDMFPDWMYHRQTPPGGEVLDIPGIAWRDLAYAAFLFTMAAALPITLSRRIDQGDTEAGIILAALRRGFMLFFFALLIGHSNTYFIGYTQEGRALAIAGFVIMFLVFTRRRSDWNERTFSVLRTFGWIAALAFLAFSPLVYGETFSPARRDQVIVELMFAAVVGSILWYVTRHHITARLAVLAGAVALYLGARGGGWIDDWWWSSPAPWLFTPSYLGLLTVVVPGTIAGDHIVQWMRSSERTTGRSAERWPSWRIFLLALVATAITPMVVFGLYNRWVALTTQVVLALAVAGVFLTWRPARPGELLLRRLFVGAAVWLLLGLLLDPFEGGIRKVPETLSYFFTVTGATMMLLVAFVALTDLAGRRTLMKPLIQVGQNPMLCYILFTVFLNSLFELVPAMRSVLRSSPGESILRSLLTVVLVVVLVQWATRKRVFWRT